MHPLYLVVILLTITANAGIAIADFAGAKSVLANAAEVKLPQSWLPALALLKSAGAVGLLIGLLGFRPLGIAAAIGLVLFFIGAIGAHVRARVLYNIAFPGTYLVLAAASLTLMTTRQFG